VDEARVDHLISERAAMRQERRFNEADAIRDELSDMGVSLWDRERVWTVGQDARPPPRRSGMQDKNNFYRDMQRRAARYERDERDYEARDARPRYQDPRSAPPPPSSQRPKPRREMNEWGHDYSRDEGCKGSVDDMMLRRVNELLKERLEAKFDRDFQRADNLLDQLARDFGVSVNDGSKQWRADGRSFERTYKRVGRAEESVDVARVEGLIRERQKARKERDYRSADFILDELLESHGVVLDDQAWSWRVTGGRHDGEYGEGGGYGRRRSTEQAKQGTHDYARERGDDAWLDAEEISEIDSLLARRMACKMRRDFGKADALQEELRSMHGVEVNDNFRTWRVSGA
jgi:cysteinyl-tRNA synthetase